MENPITKTTKRKWTGKVHEIKYQKHWHFFYMCIGDGYWTKRPLIGIRKHSFDFIWMGFQITWHYYGNAIVSGTNIKVKDYDKLLTTLGVSGN